MKKLIILCMAAGLAFLLPAPQSRAAETTYTWTASVNSTWDTSTANWSGGGTTWPGTATTALASFQSGGVGTVTIASGGVSANALTFGVTGYTIVGTTLTMVGATPTLTLSNASETVTINAVIAGSAGAKFAGVSSSSDTFILGGNNTFTGGATISVANVSFNQLADTVSSSLGLGTVAVGNSTSNATATYTGGTAATSNLWTLNGTGGGTIKNNGSGALSFNTAGTTAAGTAGNRTLNLQGTYTGANTFAQVLSDMTGGFTTSVAISTSGQWTLAGNNSYSGGTTATSGTLGVGSNNALGNGLLTLSGGNLTSATSGGITLANSVLLSSNATVLTGNGQPLTLSGPVNLNTKTLTLNANAAVSSDLTLSGSISGTGTVNVGSTLSNVTFNNDASSFDAPITMGFVRDFKFSSIGNVGGSASALGDPSTTANGTIHFQNGTSFTDFNYTGNSNAVTNRVLSMEGSSGALEIITSGSGNLEFTSDLLRSSSVTSAATLQFKPGAGTTIQWAGALTDGSGGPMTVQQTAAGETIFSGVSSYSGTTSVTSGTLLVSGSLTGTVAASVAGGASLEVDGVVNNGATATLNSGELSGTGSVGAITANGGIIAPGLTAANSLTSSGTLTAAGAVTFSGSTNFNIRLGVSDSGTDSDQLAETGAHAITLSSGTLNLTLGSGMHNLTASNVNNLYYLIINGGSGGGSISGTFANGSTINTPSGYDFSILYSVNFVNSTTINNIGSGNDVVLELTAIAPIPEPQTWAMLFSGMGLLGFFRRTRGRWR